MSARRGTATIPRPTPRRCMKRSWHSSTGKSVRHEHLPRLHRSAPDELARRTGSRVSRPLVEVPGQPIARIAGLLAGCLSAYAPAPCLADEIPLADFARHAQYEDVKMSPDGSHLAATALVNGK